MRHSLSPEESNFNSEVFFLRSPNTEKLQDTVAKEESACIHVLQPVLTYMKIFGFDHTFCRPAFRPLFKIYTAVVLLFQIAAVVGIAIQFDPPNEGLKTSTTLKIVSLVYISVGAASTILLCIFQNKRMLLVRNAIVRELPEGSQLPGHESLTRTAKILVVLTIILSFLSSFSQFATKIGFIKMPPMHVLFSSFPFWIIDVIIIWYTQSSVMMAASVLTVFCEAIRKSLKKIGEDMQKRTDGDIFKHQKQYQALNDALEILEKAYSLFILYVYAIAVPTVAFVLFTCLRGKDMDILGIIVLLFWGSGMVSSLLFVSIPPILLLEQGEELLRSCYQMYNIHVGLEKNVMLFQQSVQFLASQITSTPMKMSAGGFFILSKEMLLTMFSQILTYFIIILQST